MCGGLSLKGYLALGNKVFPTSTNVFLTSLLISENTCLVSKSEVNSKNGASHNSKL